MTGLYIHIPFCSALCPYCDFAVVVGRSELHTAYCDALVAEAAATGSWPAARTVFVGGGTPTMVDAGLLAGTLARIREHVAWDDAAEVTVEANPDSVTIEGLRTLRAAGVNRVSIGGQSFDDGVLAGLGRTHTADDIACAVDAARAAGIDTINIDLIYGAPGETDGSWRASVRAAIALDVEHVSSYALTIETGTPFGTAVAHGRLSAPDEDMLADRYELACDLLGDAGFEHYEVSNWAKPNRRCRHNMGYWSQGNYLGLGIGAHSHLRGERWWNTRGLSSYLGTPGGARAGGESLEPLERAREWLTLRLRLSDGLDVVEARRRLREASEGIDGIGDDLEHAARSLHEDGLAVFRNSRLVPTRRGMLLENVVALRLLGASELPRV